MNHADCSTVLVFQQVIIASKAGFSNTDENSAYNKKSYMRSNNCGWKRALKVTFIAQRTG